MQKCITESDAVAAVRAAEQSKCYFEDAGGGRLCVLQLENVTYWVSYTSCNTTLEIKNAYCHRMKYEEKN